MDEKTLRVGHIDPGAAGTVLLKDLRTHLKLEYNIKSLNYIRQNFIFQASIIFY